MRRRAVQMLVILAVLIAYAGAQQPPPEFQSALEFARRSLFDAELDQVNEERLIAIVLAEKTEFERAIPELIAKESWVLRRRGVRLARWRFSAEFMDKAFAEGGWHRDAAWPVREEAWRGARARPFSELLPFVSALEVERAVPVRVAIRIAQATAVDFELREAARPALQRDLDSPEASMRRAAARVLLNASTDTWSCDQMRRRLDDDALPRELRRLFLAVLWEPLESPDLLEKGPCPSGLGPLGRFDWQFRQARDAEWGESAFALLREAAALGEDLEKVWCRELARKVSVEELFRLGGVAPALQRLYLASPAGVTPWIEPAFLYRLLLRRRGQRFDERFLMEEIRIRLLMPPSDAAVAPSVAPEVLSALRQALEAKFDLDARTRAAVVDLLRRLGEPLAPSVLQGLIRERSDAMRRAAFASLVSQDSTANAELTAIALNWIDGRGPGVWALKHLVEERSEAGALESLCRRMVSDGSDSKSWSERLSALFQSARPADLRLLYARHPKLPLENRLIELGDVETLKKCRQFVVAEHRAGRPSPAEDLLALADDPQARSSIADLIPPDDARLAEEPRLARAVLGWYRRSPRAGDGRESAGVIFARELLRRLREDASLSHDLRRALGEELSAAMNEEEKLLLHLDIYQTALRWPSATRSLWEVLARIEDGELGAAKLGFPAPPKQEDGRDTQRQRRWTILRATRGDEEARRDVEATLRLLFREEHSIEERAELIRDLTWARERDWVAWVFGAETEHWRARRGRRATATDLMMASYLRELACSADEDALNSILKETRKQREADDFSLTRAEAWERTDLESAMAREGRGQAYVAELAGSLLRKDVMRPFLLSNAHFATRLLRTLQFSRKSSMFTGAMGADQASEIRFLDPSFSWGRGVSRGLSRRLRRALGPARWSLVVNRSDLDEMSSLSNRVGLVDVESCYRGAIKSGHRRFNNLMFLGDAICFGRHPEFGALTTCRSDEARLDWEGNTPFRLAMKLAAQRP